MTVELYATNRFPGDGTTTQYEINFSGGYMDKSHVKAYIEDPETLARENFVITSSMFVGPYTINVGVTTPVGKTLVIYRDTPKDGPLVDFVNGSRITEQNLDKVARQAVLGLAEVYDASNAAVVAEFTAAAQSVVDVKDEVLASTAAAAASAASAAAASADAGNVLTELAAITGSGLVGFKQSGTGAVARTALDKMREVVSVKDFGAMGDGVTDDTAAIQAAINYVSGIGGGTVLFTVGTYIVSGLVLKTKVILEGVSTSAVEIKLKSGINNAAVDVIKSANFDSLTTTGAYYPNNTNVPVWFGLKNIRVDGNKSGNPGGSGRCLSWYGTGMLMLGVVHVSNAGTDNIYTEGPRGASLGDWQTQEEAIFDTVISRFAGRYGWHYRGPKDIYVGNYLCVLDASGDYGFYSQNGTNYVAASDKIGQLHVYAPSSNITNRKGVHIVSALRCDVIYGDACSIVIDDAGVNEGACTINEIFAENFGFATGFDGLQINDSGVNIRRIIATSHAGAPAGSALKITGNGNDIGSFFSYDNSSGLCDCLAISGHYNRIGNLYIEQFGGAGKSAITLAGTFNELQASTILACKNGLNYVSGSYNRVNIKIWTNAGCTAVSGVAPGYSDVFCISSGGAVSAKSITKVISGAFPVDSTGVKTVTVSHGLVYAPNIQDISLSLIESSAVTDYSIGFIRVASVDATNVTIKVNVLTASATVASTAKIGVRASVGGL